MPSEDLPPVQFIRRNDIETKASQLLRMHGLYAIPVDPVTLANQYRITVHNAKFADDNLSGMVARRDEHVSVLVNHSDSTQRKRFTIAHELGHHFLHLLEDGEFIDGKIDLFRDSEVDGAEITDERRREIQANQFAASLLMPETLVRSAFEKIREVSKLARAFNVSESAMIFRLRDLGLLE